jgi:hypothetical protein
MSPVSSEGGLWGLISFALLSRLVSLARVSAYPMAAFRWRNMYSRTNCASTIKFENE